MDQPIRCISCGFILHPLMYKQYSDALDAGLKSHDALGKVVGLNKACYGCSRMILAHIPLVEDQIYMTPRPRPASFYAPLSDFMELHKRQPQETISPAPAR